MENYFKKWIWVISLFACIFKPVFAQDISNVRVRLDSGQKQVVISYDLSGSGAVEGDLVLQLSNDQGKSWSVLPHDGSISGDVGRGVQSGIGKKIVWQAREDFNGLVPDNFMARLSVEKLVSSASSGQSPAELQPTLGLGEQEKENQAELEKNQILPPTMIGKDGANRILIPAGYFMMGSPAGKGEKNEQPQHRVWISSLLYGSKACNFRPVRQVL